MDWLALAFIAYGIWLLLLNSTGRQPAQSNLPPGWRKRRWQL